MRRVHSELANINKELRTRGIKVFKDDQVDTDLHFRYIYKGSEDKFEISRDVAKATISVRIGKHVQAIMAELNK
ncbi:hypothetical protein YDYSG_36650 [Paenibacillus tyrfis]|nr:hypothetical protein YDYSG_36650 [Paenibacillus tyrfis]